jgi:hypothetical protein
MTALLERLGRSPEERLVIITVDGLGASNAGNEAIRLALQESAGRDPLTSSASIQVPCPWARGGAKVAAHHAEAIGVELTLNCAPENYRWGSITHSPSLNDGSGALPSTVTDLLDHADTPEVSRECRAQIGRAGQWGIEPAYLTSHLDAMVGRPEFFDVLMELAVDFGLPVRLPDPSVDLGFEARVLAESEAVLTPDRVVQAPTGRDVREAASEVLRDLNPGVTEIVARPAIDTPELRAVTPHWTARVGDAHLVTHDWGFRALLQRSGAELVSWSLLTRAQRQRATDH